MSNYKIFFILGPSFNPLKGGVQNTTHKTGKKLHELGNLIFYFSLSKEGNLDSKYGNLMCSKFTGGSEDCRNLDYLKSILKEEKPDFVINQMVYDKNLSSMLHELKNDCGFKLIGCLHNSLFSVKNNIRETAKLIIPNPFFKIVDNKFGLFLLLQIHRQKHKVQLKRILKCHDKFILLTPPNQTELKYFVNNFDKTKVGVIPNSIVNITDERLKKEKIILHVGRLNIPQKRSDLLLEFWITIHSYIPDWKFQIVGDGPYYKTLESKIKSLNLPRIELKGFQKPDEFYKKASYFIIPSAFEGFPNTILEAQSYGCITMAFDSYPALNWIVNNQVDSLISPAFDVSDLSNKLLEIIKNEDKTKEMKSKSFENVQRFSIENVGKLWMDLFNNMA